MFSLEKEGKTDEYVGVPCKILVMFSEICENARVKLCWSTLQNFSNV